MRYGCVAAVVHMKPHLNRMKHNPTPSPAQGLSMSMLAKLDVALKSFVASLREGKGGGA